MHTYLVASLTTDNLEAWAGHDSNLSHRHISAYLRISELRVESILARTSWNQNLNSNSISSAGKKKAPSKVDDKSLTIAGPSIHDVSSTINYVNLPGAIARHKQPTLGVKSQADRPKAAARARAGAGVLHDGDGCGLAGGWLDWFPIPEVDSHDAVSVRGAAIPANAVALIVWDDWGDDGEDRSKRREETTYQLPWNAM